MLGASTTIARNVENAPWNTLDPIDPSALRDLNTRFSKSVNYFPFSSVSGPSTSIGRDNTTTKGVSRTVGYHLGDNDPGDYFSVNIKRDQTYKTPVFETVAGESMCPHEDNTVAREKVQLTAEQNTIVNIPSDEPAVYKLALTNLSEAEDGQRYGLAFCLDGTIRTKKNKGRFLCSCL